MKRNSVKWVSRCVKAYESLRKNGDHTKSQLEKIIGAGNIPRFQKTASKNNWGLVRFKDSIRRYGFISKVEEKMDYIDKQMDKIEGRTLILGTLSSQVYSITQNIEALRLNRALEGLRLVRSNSDSTYNYKEITQKSSKKSLGHSARGQQTVPDYRGIGAEHPRDRFN